MGRPISIKGPVGPESKSKPGVNVKFQGNDQQFFFTFRKIARERAEMDATPFARLMIIEYVKMCRENPDHPWVKRVVQQAMKLEG